MFILTMESLFMARIDAILISFLTAQKNRNQTKKYSPPLDDNTTLPQPETLDLHTWRVCDDVQLL